MNNECWAEVDQYIVQKLIPMDDSFAAALQANEQAGLPAISVTAPQGKFLCLLARSIGARRILEVGTHGGYSTLWLTRALPEDGSLVTLELDPACSAVARSNFARAGCSHRIDLREGAALETLTQLVEEKPPPFDFVFLDADKQHHPEYFAAALELTRSGSLIVADNVVRGGEVLDPTTGDPHLQGIRRLFDLIAREPRVEATALQTVGSKGHDGFAIARVLA